MTRDLDAAGYDRRARALLTAGRFAEAVEAVRTAAALEPPRPRRARRSSGNRTMVVPALVMVLIGTVLLARQAPAGAAACLALAGVLLLGGFRGNRSE